MARTLLALGLALACTHAVACVCVEPEGSVDERVEALVASSDTVGVFVADRTWRGALEANGRRASGRWIQLRARRLFKGDDRLLPLRATRRWFRTDCDFQYRRGDVLLVFAARGQPVSSHACSASGRLEQHLDQLEALVRRERLTPASP